MNRFNIGRNIAMRNAQMHGSEVLFAFVIVLGTDRNDILGLSEHPAKQHAYTVMVIYLNVRHDRIRALGLIVLGDRPRQFGGYFFSRHG